MKRISNYMPALFLLIMLAFGCKQKSVKETFIQGIVQNIENGKDGYTAEIVTSKGDTYYATISIPNLKDPKQYRSVAKGDIIKFEGDTIKTAERTIIKVEKLYAPDTE
ncbi:hypothetical protein ACG2LH_04150 [Zhouia sp. PK063]|uniref:hypothetical protein n=1 Tax=Zhouia sp. PK063 TaxID=3373602 RepID=UPI0037BD0043